MKKNLNQIFTGAFIALLLPMVVSAQTTFFSDAFNNGSTINSSSPAEPTTNSASYEFVGSLAQYPTASVSANDLRYGITNAGGGNICEIQAVFATNPVALFQIGDHVQLIVVFTNLSGIYCTNTGGGGTTAVGFGLYNSGGSFPLGGGLNGTEGGSSVSGGVQNWQGYMAFVSDTTSSLHNQIYARPANAVNTYDQDLVTQGSSTKSFSANAGPTIGSTGPTLVPATTNIVYTNVLTITLVGAGQLAITNNLYNSFGLVTSLGGTNSASAYTTASFDGLAMGFYKKGDSFTTPYSNVVDVASITVSGSVSAPVPPVIVTQPSAVSVATGGTCAFNVNATGASLTYQWHRHGTNLIDGGNISGSTSSQLVIISAGNADVAAADANGYYVTITGAGNLSTNSMTNSLSLVAGVNLYYSGSGPWDLNTSQSWNTDDQGDQSDYFNFGDAVTFDDGGSGGTVTLTGNFLSASSVTVNEQNVSFPYTFTGSGSFAGPGMLIYKGSTQFNVNNANTYTGGTIISNATANLHLGNANGLGTGPVTLAKAGGIMEWTVAGGASSGLGDVIVADDFTMQFDNAQTYSGVFLGNLSGTINKTLTLASNPANTTTNERVRVYGTNTVCGANIAFNSGGNDLMSLAPYNNIGTQIYNGVISGDGSIWQRGSATTILNGQNTYSGGTYTTAGSIGFGANSTLTSGTVTSGPIGTGPLYISPEVGSANGSGTVFASAGAITIANTLQYSTNNQVLIIGGTNSLTFTGPYMLNGNDGLIANRTFQVNNTNASTTISGVISDGNTGCGFIKTGAGSLYLNGHNTYTGMTTNSAGLLAGSGSMVGSVIVSSTNAMIGGGTATAAGTFSIGGNLTLNGGGFFRVNRAGSSDKVSVSGTVTSGGVGTITITNLGTALQVGDTFTLFNKAVTGGATLTVTGGGVAWQNNLASNGSIQVIPGVNTNPTNIVFSVSSGNLSLSWPGDHLGWYLQVQTNALNKGLGTNWVDVPGSSSVTNVVVPLNPNNPAVFYRMSLQP